MTKFKIGDEIVKDLDPSRRGVVINIHDGTYEVQRIDGSTFWVVSFQESFYSLYVPDCITNWKCNTSTGQEEDGCGNVRTTIACTNAYTALQMIVGLIPADLRYDLNGNGIIDTGDVTLLLNGGALVPEKNLLWIIGIIILFIFMMR